MKLEFYMKKILNKKMIYSICIIGTLVGVVVGCLYFFLRKSNS